MGVADGEAFGTGARCDEVLGARPGMAAVDTSDDGRNFTRAVERRDLPSMHTRAFNDGCANHA